MLEQEMGWPAARERSRTDRSDRGNAALSAERRAAEWLVRRLAEARNQAQVMAELAHEAWRSDACAERYAAYEASVDVADAVARDLRELRAACLAVGAMPPAPGDGWPPAVDDGPRGLAARLARLVELCGHHHNAEWPADFVF
jgi:hypothetical protein